MAETTRKRSGELLRGLFKVLLPHPDGLKANVALERLETEAPPTDFEKADYPSRPGVRRFEKIVRFMSINAVKAGWMIKNKGQWTLTDEGRSAYEKHEDPEVFMSEAVRLYREWKQEQPQPPEKEEEEEPFAATSVEEAEESAWNEIEKYLGDMPPYDFQKLVAALLEAMDYHVAWIAPLGPDKGVDIVAFTDPLGTSGPRIKVQVKRRGDRISAAEMRSFMAVLADEDVGIFISVGGFTSDAESEARMQERRKLTLIDLQRLVDLWTENYDSVSVSKRALLPLRPIYFLTPPGS